uniref:Uncharacterized protein n=1 Tax=viral metagenome TaxID=1070528 RepID=A0A6C0ITZ0_9ZZZZ
MSKGVKDLYDSCYDKQFVKVFNFLQVVLPLCYTSVTTNLREKIRRNKCLHVYKFS